MGPASFPFAWFIVEGPADEGESFIVDWLPLGVVNTYLVTLFVRSRWVRQNRLPLGEVFDDEVPEFIPDPGGDLAHVDTGGDFHQPSG